MANGGNALSAAMWNGRANEESAHLNYSQRARPGCAVWNTITSAPYVVKKKSASCRPCYVPGGWVGTVGDGPTRRHQPRAAYTSESGKWHFTQIVSISRPFFWPQRPCARTSAMAETRRSRAGTSAPRVRAASHFAVRSDVYKGVSTERGNCGNSSIFRRKRSD